MSNELARVAVLMSTRSSFCRRISRGYARDRREGFHEQCKQMDVPCHDFEWPDTVSNNTPIRDGLSDKAQAFFRAWLTHLPKPLGVFAYQDYLGFTLSEVCRQIGMSVPEQIGLVGADDDEMVCQFAYPQPSSVHSPMKQVGFEAAQALDKLMNGGAIEEKSILFSPTTVITRRSTDITTTSDSTVSQALLFIRENADKPIQVEDVLDQVAISRRSLEHKFKALLNRTPLAEIHRVHVEQAKRLLTETELPISVVAERSGFSSTSQMNMVFRRNTGKSPREFRRQPRNY
ncbi:MAG: substrate-binding domain-containing protein [Phycisphaerales bacterium]